MTYWLVNSGTTEDPLSSEPGAVHSAFVNWDREHGPVHGLDRAYKMRPGDILVYRTVGMPVSRLVAAAEVEEAPVEKPFLRWGYQVRREVFALVDTLRNAPAFDLLEVPPVRVTKRLDADTGEQAVGLIRRATSKK